VIRLVFADGDRRERELLRDAVVNQSDLCLVGVARDGQEAVQMAVQYRPDVVILREDLKVLDGYEAAGLISAAAPGVKTVMIVKEESPEAVRRAMKIGVRQCVALPVTAPIILEAAREVAEVDEIKSRSDYQTALDPEQFPRVIAVTGAKGGVGKTSLATNLAVALARANNGQTCLVDLYTQYGDVGTLLNIHARQTLVDLLKMDDQIDLDVIDQATVTHVSGLHVLLGSSAPTSLDALPVDVLDQVFSALRRRYRFIVVDVPPILHAGTLHVLENAHQVLLVCNLQDLTTVADTSRLVKSVRDSYVPRERLRLVLNRVGRQNYLAIELVEKTLGLPAWMQVPNDEQLVSQCTNRGIPFVLDAPNHPVSQAVRQIATTLMEKPDAEQIGEAVVAEARREKRGLWRLIGRTGAVLSRKGMAHG
jgi:pilus assembly protein CpaE